MDEKSSVNSKGSDSSDSSCEYEYDKIPFPRVIQQKNTIIINVINNTNSVTGDSKVPNNEKKGINKIYTFGVVDNNVGKNKGNAKNEIIKEDAENLNIYFTYEDRNGKKEIYIESEGGKKFGEIIEELHYKYPYLWMKAITDYELNGKKLDTNLTALQNGIFDNAYISIIFKS